jgi:hypothetical protein
MKRVEAQALMVKITTAFPHIPVAQPSLDLYVERLLPLDVEVGSRAVEMAIAENDFFPSIAAILKCVGEVKAEEKRKRDEVEQRERYASEDEIERLPIAEIPGLPEFLTRLNVGGDPDKPMPFRRTAVGVCDDCFADRRARRVSFEQAMGDEENVEDGQPIPPGPRYVVGRFQVCYEHAAARLRVAQGLET